MIFFGTACFGQNGPLRSPVRFGEGVPVEVRLFQTSVVPDSTRFSLISGRCSFTDAGAVPVFLAVTNAGAVLAFADSACLKPLPLEKRASFPFRNLKNFSSYRLEIARCVGPDGYLAARLVGLSEGEILDEVFLCLPHDWMEVSGIEFGSAPWISVKK